MVVTYFYLVQYSFDRLKVLLLSWLDEFAEYSHDRSLGWHGLACKFFLSFPVAAQILRFYYDFVCVCGWHFHEVKFFSDTKVEGLPRVKYFYKYGEFFCICINVDSWGFFKLTV